MLSVYTRAWPPLGRWLRRGDPGLAHERTIELLRRLDGLGPAVSVARVVGRAAMPDLPTRVGGVTLPTPLILAAGFVKGDGFGSEGDALVATARRRDLLPGWRIMPALVGAVEFGSYTRRPRLGNGGPVVWRDDATRTTHNRVGLRNPGAAAAAAFLGARRADLPMTWGVSVAVSPGVEEAVESGRELGEAVTCFERAFSPRGAAAGPGGPSWYTLNLSCPNTEDDPAGRQTGELARRLAGAVVGATRVPVWVKVGPRLAAGQYDALVDALAGVGVRAIVATNTLAVPSPTHALTAGMGGAGLRPHALAAVRQLADAIDRRGAPIDLIGSGGILEGRDLRAFLEAGARAAMVYSGLVFRGPLAAALILRESAREAAPTAAPGDTAVDARGATGRS